MEEDSHQLGKCDEKVYLYFVDQVRWSDMVFKSFHCLWFLLFWQIQMRQ